MEWSLSSPKTDNSNLAIKLKVRRWLFEQFDNRRVLDLYCGRQGKMHQGLWNEADLYFGTDKNCPHRFGNTVKMSAEYASQHLDISDFNIFDVDCYASPWRVARRILRRHTGGRLGIVMTSGEYRGLENGRSSEIVRRSIGASGLSDYRLLGRFQDSIIRLMIRSLGEIAGVKLLKGVVAQTNTHIVYLALTLDKQAVV